ncbi:MAG: hypothetical protein V3S98_05185, partial [Dehalococcoidia bacterium]
MPHTKGSKVAASRARAQAAAKKKARSTGPTLPAAAFVKPKDSPPVDDELEEELDDVAGEDLDREGLDEEREPEETAVATVNQPARQRVAAAPHRTPRVAASRRLRDGAESIPTHGLAREIGTIGVITALVGVALAVL